MYHSIIFGNKNSWADWYLIPASRPVFNPPAPKTKYVEVPGADWHLDLSTSLTGDMQYSGRSGSFEFIVDNGQLSDYNATSWHVLYSDILNYLHGKLMRATLEDDPSFFYQGRFAVNQWKSEPHNSRITIDYEVAPYKYEAFSSIEDWEWDTFNFETDIVREYKDLEVNGEYELVIIGRRMSVTPVFEVNSTDGKGMSVVFANKTYQLNDGTSRIVNIKTREGTNKLLFKGNGTVSVEYRGGCL